MSVLVPLQSYSSTTSKQKGLDVHNEVAIFTNFPLNGAENQCLITFRKAMAYDSEQLHEINAFYEKN